MALKVGLFSFEQPDFLLSNAPRLHRLEHSIKKKIQGEVACPLTPPPPQLPEVFLWTVSMPANH